MAAPRVRDLLLRFRPSGSPGRAGPAGVPVDLPQRLSAELEPLFALLATTEDECAAIVEDGRRRAALVQRTHAERAAAVRAGMRERAEAERAASGASSHASATAAGADLDKEVDALVGALRSRAQSLVPAYVARVTAAVDRLCSQPPDGGGP
ncbi:hypothetical protein ABEG17_16995 [Pedococcus sp. KACC 23699]|uniref:Uncharacterized protein n=1 Tax=Pedococcus sp. KACC 23699 TaxID=3149228 RepID=A0AAU7JSN0_9MICO